MTVPLPPDSAEARIATALTGVFESVSPSPAPDAVLLMGGPGSVPARAVAQLLAESAEPIAILQTEDLAALLGGGGRAVAAVGVQAALRAERKGGVEGNRVSVSVDLGGSRLLKKKKQHSTKKIKQSK